MSELVELKSWSMGQLVDRYINPDNVLYVEKGDRDGQSIVVLAKGYITVEGRPNIISSYLGVK